MRCLAALCLAAGPALAAAEVPPDTSDWTRRYYLNVRFAESAPFSRAHDAVGLSLGAELCRHVGLELAATSTSCSSRSPAWAR